MKPIIRTLSLAMIAALPLICQTHAKADDSPSISPRATAEYLVREMAKVYKNASAITDTITVTLPTRNGQQTVDFNVLVDKGTDAQVTVQDHTFAAKGNQVYVWRKSLISKYVKMDLNENLLQTVRPITFPIPYLGLRYAKDPKDYVKALGLGMSERLELTGVEQVKKDGSTYAQLNLKDESNTVNILVDEDSKLIKSIRMQGSRGLRTFQMKTKILTSLKQKIGIDTRDRRAVAAIKDLVLGVGDFAPGFELQTLDGETINLQQLRGSAVVLDFWATWCGPCRQGLPKLQEFADWVQQQNLDIEVFAVDIGEHQPTTQKKQELVKQFWTSRRFTMTTLMDYDDSVSTAFEVSSIPHTVVIGPDGRIVAVHVGFNPKMDESLKRETVKALTEAG